MRITPLDVRKQEFRKVVRGLDPEEVYAFLATVADEYETVLTDNKQLRDRVLELDEKVTEYRNMEKTLRDTLLTAERVMAEAKENARKEGEFIVRDARLSAEKDAAALTSRLENLRSQVQQLRTQRDGFLARLRGLAEAQIGLVQGFANDFAEEEGRTPAHPAPAPAEVHHEPASAHARHSTEDDRWRDYSPAATVPAIDAPASFAAHESPASEALANEVLAHETRAHEIPAHESAAHEAHQEPSAPLTETAAPHTPMPEPEAPVVTGVDDHDTGWPAAPARDSASYDQPQQWSDSGAVADVVDHAARQAEVLPAAEPYTAANTPPVVPAMTTPKLDLDPMEPSGHPMESVAPYLGSGGDETEAAAAQPSAAEDDRAAMAAQGQEEPAPAQPSRWSISRFTKGLGEF